MRALANATPQERIKMFNLNRYELEKYIGEDIPYLDFTTYLQDTDARSASLSIYTRERVVVACIEEVCNIAKILGCSVKEHRENGDIVEPSGILAIIEGSYINIHKAWKLCQVLLEHTCAIATYTRNMLDEIEAVNKGCQLLGTRKTFPLAKKLCIKSIMSGGGMPHRLNLSDSILFFKQHRAYYASDAEFYKHIPIFKRKAPEKKIVVESECYDDSLALMQAGVDVVQLDKAKIELVKEVVALRDERYKAVQILCAGGIKMNNAKEYAATMIDGIVTSAMYTAGLSNLSSNLEIIS